MKNIPWTESPFFEEELRTAGLSDGDKAFVKSYAENGYAIFDPGIPEFILDGAVQQMLPAFAKIKGKDKRIQDGWKQSPAAKLIAADPVVHEKLKLLYRRQPIPFQTLSFPVGTEQATHSDMIHFGSIPARFMCGVWVALEDITDLNGPLHYYPGSHKLPFFDMIDVGVKASDNREGKRALMVYAKEYVNFIQKMIDSLGLEKHTLNIKKGQAIIWSANLLHGGNKILAPGSSRHSQVTHYFFEDCMYYTPRLFSDVAINKIHLNDLTNIATGERVVNTYFGKKVRPEGKLFIEQKARRMLSRVASLLPKEFVEFLKG